MTTAQLSPSPVFQFIGPNGLPLAYGKLYSYAAGTSTPQVTYPSSSEATPNTNPIILSSFGTCNLWLDPSLSYKLNLTDSNGNQIPNWPVDNIQGFLAVGGSLIPSVTNLYTLGSPSFSWAQLYLGPNAAPAYNVTSNTIAYYGVTAAETSASVIPVNYAYEPQTAIRYAVNTVPGSTNMAVGIQAAIDSASSSSATVLLADQNAISTPLLIRSTTQESIGLYGNARVVTELEPLAASISTSPININALIICQNNNAHLHLTHLRSADSNFTGYFMYALSGGGSDSSCKASFSMVVDDCWFSPSANGQGVFYGGYSNFQMTNCVAESTKAGVLRLAGAGCSDISCVNIAMFNCYDAFIYGADDTQTKAILTVGNLHAYNHYRGPVFQVNNGIGLNFHDIIVEPNASQVGTVGLFSFQDCAEIDCHDATLHSRSGAPQAAGPAISIVNGATGKFANVTTDALIGVQFSGSGVLNVEFENCDFSGTIGTPTNTPLQILSGSQSGQVIFRGCRFNQCTLEGFIDTAGTNSANWWFYDCEFLNAGIGGSTNPLIDIALAGNIYFIRCTFGQTSVSADAAYYFGLNGAGSVFIIDPIILGAPPTGLNNGTQSPIWDGVDSSMPGMPQFVPSLGGSTTYTTQTGTWSIKNKTLSFQGNLTVNAIGTGSASTISGLPFASAPTTDGGGGANIAYYTGLATTYVTIAGFIDVGASSIKLRGATAAAAANASANALTSSSAIIFSGQYRVYT